MSVGIQLLDKPGLFEFQNPLTVSDIRDAVTQGADARKIFLEEVHELHVWSPEDIFLEAKPRILCRPSGEGKSTELNYVRYLFDQFRPGTRKHVVSVQFDHTWTALSRGDLFRFLREKLRVANALTLADVIRKARLKPLLLLLDNVEFLSEDALIWLLASVHSLEEVDEKLLAEQQVFIALAGSVGVGQLSRELYSVYYTDELPARIRDYSKGEIERIGMSLEQRLGVSLASSALSAVHRLTEGEKRTANLLFDLLVSDRVDPQNAREISEESVESAVSQLLAHRFRRDFRWLQTARELAHTASARNVVASLVRHGRLEWLDVPPNVQKTLYNAGLVTVESGLVRPRNQIVHLLLDRAVFRAKRAKTFLTEVLPQGSLLPNPVRKKRGVIRRFLLEQAFVGHLVWIYYGEVVDNTGDVMRIRFVDEEGHEFEAEMHSDDLGMPLLPGQGFLKFAISRDGHLREEYYIYGNGQ